MDLDEIRGHMQERNFAANGVFKSRPADETIFQAERRVLSQLADDVPDLVGEVERLQVKVDEAHMGWASDSQKMTEFAREFFGDQEGKTWAAPFTLGKLLEMLRDKMRQDDLQNSRYQKALEHIATMDERVEPLTWGEAYAEAVKLSKETLSGKRNCEHDWELVKSHGPWPETNRCKRCGDTQ